MTIPDSRDRLAAECAHPADERTLVAHLRTGLVLCAGGAASLELLGSLGPTLVGWLPLALESAAVSVGGLRFVRVRVEAKQVAGEPD